MCKRKRWTRGRSGIAALLVVPLFVLAGCAALFEFNAFAALDLPPAPKVADYEGVAGLARLASDLDSAAVVAELSKDPSTVQEIKDYLSQTYLSGPLTTPDQQTAAILYADLSLKTTSGDQLVNNVVTSLLTTSMSGNLKTIIGSIIPADVAGDVTAFAAMVNGLLDANAAYQMLGDSIPPAPPGMNMGDVAQKAAVAYMMRSVVDAARSLPLATDAEAIAELFKLVEDDPACQITGITMTDPYAGNPAFLVNLFDAAGAPYPA